MFGSTILDVAIGLVFIFLLLSIICSAANELIELGLKKRSRDLERGIAELIGNPKITTAFLTDIYNHGLINALYRGSYKAKSRKLPAYIPATNFALALIDVVAKPPTPIIPLPPESKAASKSGSEIGSNSGKSDDTPEAIAKLAKEKTELAAQKAKADTLVAAMHVNDVPKNVVSAMAAFKTIADAGGKKVQESVEEWFNSSMDRVSGWYKRRTQIFILFMGLALAVFVNADCIQIAQRLSSDASLRQAVVALAEAAAKNPPPGVAKPKDDKNNQDAPKDNKPTESKSQADPKKPVETTSVDVIKDNIKTLEGLGLPIGWPDETNGRSRVERAKDALKRHTLGWILTALAVSLGAPFWFDMLNKIMVIRSSVKPHEKSPEEGSKDKTSGRAKGAAA